MKTETKVGILTLAAAAGLVWLSVETGNVGSSFKSSNYRMLETTFTTAEGLNVGSKVKMSGVQVGEVANIRLRPDGRALVELAIQQGTPLPANIQAQVASAGLIGEKFVSLSTDFGAANETLPDGVAAIPSKPAASIDDIATNFAKISSDLESVSAALRGSLGGPENAERLNRIMSSIDNIGQKLEGILVDEVKDGQVSNIMDNLQAMSANLAEVSGRLERGEGTLGKLLTKDSSTMDDLEVAMKDFRETMDKINSGEGTIGRLVNDPSTVEKIEDALDSLAGTAGRLEQFRTEVDFYGYSLIGEDNIAKGRLEVTLAPRPYRFYVIGVTSDGFASYADDPRRNTSFAGEDFGDEFKITAQFGHVYQNALFGNDLSFRIGLKDSTFGLGADVDLPVYAGHFIEVSADAYDFSGSNSGNDEGNPHLDLTAKINLLNKTIYAVGGYDNMLSSKYGAPFVGLGFRFQDDDFKYLMGQAL